MGAFDTAFTPKSLAPANTTEAALFTAGTDSSSSQDVSCLVDVSNIGSATIAVRIGIKPSGGSTHWRLYDASIPAADSILGIGPWFLQSGDAIQVRTDTADDAVFSVTGVESS